MYRGRDSSNAVAICVLVFLGVTLSLAVPAAGDMRAVIAGGKAVGHHVIHAASQKLMMTTTRMEDVVARELGVEYHMDLELQQRVLGGTSRSSGLEPNEQVCLPKCTDPGQPYVGRGCDTYHRCR
uniref:Uncharacterized protein n=1 Tax=Leersia perrieri TaxID=77586 RepID=A0A0D9W3U0_9ORYZ